MVQVYKFTKPYQFDGVEFTEVEFDLDSVTGKDVSEAKKRLQREVPVCLILGADSDFCAHLLAIITKKPVEFYREMPARDYLELTQTVSNFLTNLA